jgi:hypothetical protein
MIKSFRDRCPSGRDGPAGVIPRPISLSVGINQGDETMRIPILTISLFLLTACQTTAEVTCADKGYERDSPEFQRCVAGEREAGSIQMMEEAGEGGLGRRTEP